MKVSIITVTKNSARTIERTVHSVASQQNVQVEHVIKDANSVDKTVMLAKAVNPKLSILVQSDIGIYDGMNQGFFHSTGEIVAFLNSDDYYVDSNVLSDVLGVFKKTACDFVYGDICMRSLTGEIVREWKTGEIGQSGLVGMQIPHPALFIKRSVLNGIGLPFDPSYKISADLKQQLIMINQQKFKGVYINRTIVEMENGGMSTNSFASYYLGWKESVRAYSEVFGSGGLNFVFRKVVSKFRGLKLLVQLKNFGK
jgi:glycosyltransferase involved in cell wall biosynthesis